MKRLSKSYWALHEQKKAKISTSQAVASARTFLILSRAVLGD